MSFKSWIKKRRDEKDKKHRLNNLTEDEIIELSEVEKKAYIEIAKKQVLARGRLNAYKDFHIPEIIPKTDMAALTKDLEENTKLKEEIKKLKEKEKVEEDYSGEDEYNPEDFQQSEEDYLKENVEELEPQQRFKRPVNNFREVVRNELRRKHPQREMRRVSSLDEMQEGREFRRKKNL